MPLVINNVGGEHTHTHKHTCILDNSNFNKLGMCWPVAGSQTKHVYIAMCPLVMNVYLHDVTE